MNIPSKFNTFLALYLFINVVFIFLLIVLKAKFVWNNIFGIFYFFALFGPVIVTLISLAIKLKFETYSWLSFTKILISMILALVINFAILIINTVEV